MKTFLLAGYYGFKNIGDEAVLQAIIAQLQEHIPAVKINVLSNSPQETAAAYGVEAANRWQLASVWKAIKHCDVFLCGGGSLLQNVTGNKSLMYYLAMMLMAWLQRKPVVLYAQGIGPISGRLPRFLTARMVKKARLITVRDENSQADLVQMGINKEQIIVTCDPVLAWQDDSLTPPLPAGKKIGVSLRHWQGFSLSEIALTCDLLVQDGWQLVFLPYHEPEDRLLSQQVRETMKEDSFLLPVAVAPGVMMALISQMDFVIGMRLHALIMATAQGVPAAALSYDPKIDSFFAQTGQKIITSVGELNGNDFYRAIAAILDDLSAEKKQLAAQLGTWKKLAACNGILAREIAFGVPNPTLAMAEQLWTQESAVVAGSGR